MMKIFCIGAISIATMHYSQTFPVNGIPESLKRNADAVIRKDFTIVQINKINEIKYQYNTVTTVLNKDGVAHAIVFIPYEKGDHVYDVKVTVYDEFGKKVKNFSKSDFKDFSNNSQSSFYSDSRILILPYVSVQYPYTIDFSYSTINENTVFIPDFVPFSTINTSLEEAQFKIINKSGIELRTKIYPSQYNYSAVIEKNDSEGKEYMYRNIAAIDEVSLLPQPVKILPKVSFSLAKFNLEGKEGDINSWKEFGIWYYNNILQPVSISTPSIKAEVTSLNLQGSTEDKVKKLYQYMQTKTRYIFVALGIGGWQPMLPDEVHKKGYGDCKGLTNYMRMLLEEAGIPSYYCVINSSPSQVSFDPNFPKMGGNHVILMVPTEKGNIWLENTSQQIAFNHLSYSTTDRNTLLIKKDGIELINTPSYSVEQNNEKQVLTVKINEDNSIDVEGVMSFTGSQYDHVFGYISLSPKEKNEVLKKQFDVLNLEKVEMKDFINDRDKVIAKFQVNFKALNFSKKAGNSLMFRAIPIFSSTIYKSDENRELPFEINQSFEDDYDIDFVIPQNYKIEEIPENFSTTSEFGEYSLKIVKNGDYLKIQRVIKINKGIYTKDKYNSYVNFRKKIINVDNSKILITKI
ncbi:DUF3857 domain-containing protein [Chryseobacterium sp. ERMR1:04]|uniref:DUF3857 domain-containing protein n=1 Tax=Chryseobacterium sp. ERMR1:04 TaxID=1705393 RepID=UPI0006C87C49|nr:DUF3857 domain-containing protein [Chryseobacterium sp. ERMR1:04]KPH13030.1 GTPase [Chryseobacterium sp. ERMR1:04]